MKNKKINIILKLQNCNIQNDNMCYNYQYRKHKIKRGQK